jgi:hypothetical protein
VTLQLERIIDGATGVLPLDTQLENWLQKSAEGGRRRHHAAQTLFEQASRLGLTAFAVVGASWLDDARSRDPVWQLPPWTATDGTTLHAEGIGQLDPDRIADVLDAVLGDPDLREPPALPRLMEVHGGAPTFVADLSVARQRVAFVVLVAVDSTLLKALAADPRASNALVLATGLLRGDAHRVREERLARLLATVRPTRAWQPGDRPFTAQEVIEHAARIADGVLEDLSGLFETRMAGLYVPDPDDHHVWCLGRHGLGRHAYEAGTQDGLRLEGVRFGLTASYAMGVAFDADGSSVVVRALADRRALLDRYEDLGFDEDTFDRPGSGGVFDPERFHEHDERDGPWVFTAQRLPLELSPNRRNLVLRLQGRSTSTVWADDDVRHRTPRDRKRRLAAAARRAHADIVQSLTDGLRAWRDGVRDEVLRSLPRNDWSATCRVLAERLSARCVSIFEVVDERLDLRGWSSAGSPPTEGFDLGFELHDPRESALLRTTLRPVASEVGVEGFLRWPPFEEALGGRAENVATMPIVRGSRTVGLLRVDGAMALFGAHLRRGTGQDALVRFRPPRTPDHVWRAMEDVVSLLALVLADPTTPGRELHWPSFVEDATHGVLQKEEAVRVLVDLRAQHGSRGDAAEAVGVHRNTFRRHLARLEEAIGFRW